jgi:CRISPR-associated protein Csd1
LYAAPHQGAVPVDEDRTRFYVLSLAPNAARIAIRFWHHTTVGKLAKHIRQHFDDLCIVHGPKEQEFLPLFRLLLTTAALGKRENIPPNLAADTTRAILAGTPYPRVLISAVIRRIHAEPHVDYARAALIKAVLVRNTRIRNPNQQEVDMSLDEKNTNTGYRLGRLFAVLERIQELANPGINATIRDRFYASASSIPVTAFPHLMKLKNHHLSKLENRGQIIYLEKWIGQIMDGIDKFPAHLSLDDQGRFSIGYYHQRQAFFIKSENKIGQGEQA